MANSPECPEEANKDLHRLILESTPHCIAVIDRELRLVYANQSFIRTIKQVSGMDIRVGQDLLDTFPKDRLLRYQLRLQEILSGQCTRVEEVFEVDGSTRYFDVIYQPLNSGNSWDKVVIHFHEITARKRKEKKLLDDEVELRETIATRETLLSIISHDLRAPIFQLNSLLFIIQQASESRDERRLQMYAEDLEERISSLTHTLDNLLSWSAFQRKSLEPQLTRFSLKSVISQAVGLMKPVAQRKGVSFRMTRVEDVYLNSDREMVAFIIRNLINNAIKFSMQNGKIEITAFEQNEVVIFSTLDEGIGVEPNRIRTLREGKHFFTEAGTWGERGTGLGLKLCYEFAERLEGIIDFSSTPGKGTSVTVKLPNLSLP